MRLDYFQMPLLACHSSQVLLGILAGIILLCLETQGSRQHQIRRITFGHQELSIPVSFTCFGLRFSFLALMLQRIIVCASFLLCLRQIMWHNSIITLLMQLSVLFQQQPRSSRRPSRPDWLQLRVCQCKQQLHLAAQGVVFRKHIARQLPQELAIWFLSVTSKEIVRLHSATATSPIQKHYLATNR